MRHAETKPGPPAERDMTDEWPEAYGPDLVLKFLDAAEHYWREEREASTPGRRTALVNAGFGM